MLISSKERLYIGDTYWNKGNIVYGDKGVFMVTDMEVRIAIRRNVVEVVPTSSARAVIAFRSWK